MDYMKILQNFEPTKNNLIAILHSIQNNNSQNYISEEAMQAVSDYLKVPISHIYGVVKFYSMFSDKPRGKYVIRLCESPPCYLRGSEKLLKHLVKKLNIGLDKTTQDGLFTLELTSCLGVCGNAPVMMINDDIYGDLTTQKIDTILSNLKNEERVKS